MQKPLNNYAFIDEHNTFMALRELGLEIDWKEFRKHLTEKYHIQECFIFTGFLESHRKRYLQMHEWGFTFVFKETSRFGKVVKANVDVEITVQVMKEFKKFHQLLLVTNDGDFASLVQYLKGHGKFQGILSPNLKKCARILKKTAEGRIQNLLMSEKVLIKKIGPYSSEAKHRSFTARGDIQEDTLIEKKIKL